MMLDELMLVVAVVATIELLCLAHICRHMSTVRSCTCIRIVAAVLYIVLAVVQAMLSLHIVINIIAKIVVVYLYTYTGKMQWFKRILTSVFFVLVALLIEYIIAIVISLLTGMEIVDWQSSASIYAMVAIVAKLLTYAVIMLTFKRLLSNGILGNTRSTVLSLLIALTTVVAIVAIVVMSLYSEDVTVKLLAVVASLVLIIANVVVLVVYQCSINASMQMQIAQHEQRSLQREKQELTALIDSQIRANKEIHETKNKIYAIRQMLQDDQAKAIDMIDTLCNIFSDREIVPYIGIAEVDVLINTKCHVATSNNRQIRCKVNIQQSITMDSVDMCMVVGNLLDNALQHSDSGAIMLNISTRGQYLSIACINNMSAVQGSSRGNSDIMHGFGLDRVATIAECYDGNFATVIEHCQYNALFLAKMA